MRTKTTAALLISVLCSCFAAGTAQASDPALLLDNSKALAPALPMLNQGFNVGLGFTVGFEPYALPPGAHVVKQTVEVYAETGAGQIRVSTRDFLMLGTEASVTTSGGPAWVAATGVPPNNGNYYVEESFHWSTVSDREREEAIRKESAITQENRRKDCLGANEGGRYGFFYYCPTWPQWVNNQTVEVQMVKYSPANRVYEVVLIDEILKEGVAEQIVRYPAQWIAGGTPF